ncbi:MAG: outer membrane beta-barrel protein [Pseudomonadota bacterium]
MSIFQITKNSAVAVSAIGFLFATVVSGTASAQPLEGPYVGAQIGFHGVDDGDDVFNIEPDIGGFIYGAYGGYTARLNDYLLLGLEGNFNLGTADIDRDAGINANIGVPIGRNASVFLRGGYQWVNFDLENIAEDILNVELTPAQIDLLDAAEDGDGGFLVGAGVQIGIGPNLSLRTVIDTIEFDTVRATGGVTLHF